MKDEIFTVGDYTNNGTITKFIQKNNDIRVYFKEKPNNYHVSLKTLKKSNKEYTILSFKAINGGEIYECLGMNNESKYLDSPQYFVINSIRRESDGEIFSIGDNTTIGIIKQINKQSSYCEYPIGIIGSVNSCALDFKYINGPNKNKFMLYHSKTKLFTTEDKVNIFEGDTFYWLDKGLNINNSGYSKLIGTPHNTLYFSTKEKAEGYIYRNKPCLSYDDIIKLRDRSENIQISKCDLMTLVKEKLK